MHNSSKKPKILAIVGKTATGKSDLGVFLAEQLDGEIISADSRQVYKGLNLGTGKISVKEMRGIPHHLLDVADPKDIFSVEQYIERAQGIVGEIINKGKLPIIVGGTGFYIDSLISGKTFPHVEPNYELRKKLQLKTEEELFEILKDKDNERALSIDKHNKVRLIRAIEIVESLGKVPPNTRDEQYDCVWIGVDLPDETLKQRINKRLQQRIDAGMLYEAKKLVAGGLSHERMEQLGLEYRHMSRLLRKEINENEFIEELSKEIWQYAKRQKMWFKRNKKIEWHNPENKILILERLKSLLK